jgi:hypothetical protein
VHSHHFIDLKIKLFFTFEKQAEEAIRKTLDDLINFPLGVDISYFPLHYFKALLMQMTEKQL